MCAGLRFKVLLSEIVDYRYMERGLTMMRVLNKSMNETSTSDDNAVEVEEKMVDNKSKEQRTVNAEVREEKCNDNVKEVSGEESVEPCCEEAHVEVTATVETRDMKMKQKSPPNH